MPGSKARMRIDGVEAAGGGADVGVQGNHQEVSGGGRGWRWGRSGTTAASVAIKRKRPIRQLGQMAGWS